LVNTQTGRRRGTRPGGPRFAAFGEAWGSPRWLSSLELRVVKERPSGPPGRIQTRCIIS